jgi:hypothetical protein
MCCVGFVVGTDYYLDKLHNVMSSKHVRSKYYLEQCSADVCQPRYTLVYQRHVAVHYKGVRKSN